MNITSVIGKIFWCYFIEKGLLSEERPKELRHQLQKTESAIWDVVIPF